MRNIWKPAKNLIVDVVDDNCLLFKFRGKGDRDQVMEGRPWLFDKQVLLHEEVDLSAQLRKMVIETTPFWIRLYDLPILG